MITSHMDITKYDVYKSPNIGVYTKVNDDYIFIPNGMAKTKAEKLAKYLDVEYHHTTVADTRLLGPLMVLNNNGVLLPGTINQREFDFFKKELKLNVGILDSKITALGNLIAANDKAAVVSPMFEKNELEIIKNVLGVEVLQKKIAGYNQTGVMLIATAKNGVISMNTNTDDMKEIQDFMKVGLVECTINGGVPYLSSGILANNKSVVVGSVTSGTEIMTLTSAFMN